MLHSRILQLSEHILCPLCKPLAPTPNWSKSRNSSKCREGCYSARKSKYFDVNKVIMVRGQPRDCQAIKCFINKHHWPSEPTVNSLFVPLDSPYLKLLTHKYATQGDRMMALEGNVGSPQNRLVGLSVTNTIHPRWPRELDQWAQVTDCRASKARLHFYAHVIRATDLFAKYDVNSILEVEVLAVASDWRGRGVGRLLMRNAIESACELHYPLVVIVCTNRYASKICEKMNMKREWSVKYDDFVDQLGGRLFYPRLPHSEAVVYTKKIEDCYF